MGPKALSLRSSSTSWPCAVIIPLKNPRFNHVFLYNAINGKYFEKNVTSFFGPVTCFLEIFLWRGGGGNSMLFRIQEYQEINLIAPPERMKKIKTLFFIVNQTRRKSVSGKNHWTGFSIIFIIKSWFFKIIYLLINFLKIIFSKITYLPVRSSDIVLKKKCRNISWVLNKFTKI